MLTIKRQQRELAGELAFVERTIEHFRDYHEETVGLLDDDELRRRVARGIERGRGWGLTWEYSLTVFVAHMFEICPTFDEHPAIRRVLSDALLPPDERIDALLERVKDEEWEEIVQDCDPEGAWRSLMQEDQEEDED